MGKGFKKNTVAQVMRLKKGAYNDHHSTKNNCIPLHMSVYNNLSIKKQHIFCNCVQHIMNNHTDSKECMYSIINLINKCQET